MKTATFDNRITFVVPQVFRARLKSAAESEGMTVSEFVRGAVRAQLAKVEREQKGARQNAH